MQSIADAILKVQEELNRELDLTRIEYRGDREEIKHKIAMLSDLLTVIRCLETTNVDLALLAVRVLGDCVDRFQQYHDLDID